MVTVFGSIMGSIPGGYVLNAIPAAYLQILLGIMLLAVMLLMGRKFEINIQNKTAGRIAAGFISGFSAAMTSISGPPVALYFLAEGRDKSGNARPICAGFLPSGSLGTMASLLAAGSFISAVFNAACSFMRTAAVFRQWLGERCFHKINQRLFIQLSKAFVVIGACTALYRGITSLM